MSLVALPSEWRVKNAAASSPRSYASVGELCSSTLTAARPAVGGESGTVRGLSSVEGGVMVRVWAARSID